jgi:hypothetical protein
MELKVHQRRFAAARPARKCSPKAALRVPNAFGIPAARRWFCCRGGDVYAWPEKHIIEEALKVVIHDLEITDEAGTDGIERDSQ